MTVLIGAVVAALTAYLLLAPQRRADRQLALARAQLALAKLPALAPRTCTVCRSVDCKSCHECERRVVRRGR